VDVALLDHVLPDQNGVDLGLLLRDKLPLIEIILMTGSNLPPKEEDVCRRNNSLVVKPFLIEAGLEAVRRRLRGRLTNVRKAT
jgi:CheY-like chemotaxis protein